MHWACGQCRLLCKWVVCSNIVIAMSTLDMWSVFYVPYVAIGV